MAFRVGMKVVCVDDEQHGRYSPFLYRLGLSGLRGGEIYTVRWIGHFLGVDILRVEEIIRPYSSVMEDENAYAAARFRPIVSRKTNIDVFTAMLKPSDVTVEAMRIADHVREMVR